MGSARLPILSDSLGRDSCPGAFRSCIPRTARLDPSSVGADLSSIESAVVNALGRYFTSNMMAGFNVGDFLLSRMRKRVGENLAHRCRISSLFLSRTPFSSLMYCSLPGFLTPRSTELLRCSYRPPMSRYLQTASNLATHLSRYACTPSSITVRGPLHAALSPIHDTKAQLSFTSRRTSRRLASASSTVVLVSGISHHCGGIRGIRVSSGVRG